MKTKFFFFFVSDDILFISIVLSFVKSLVYVELFDTLNDVDVKKVNRRLVFIMGIYKRKVRVVF